MDPKSATAETSASSPAKKPASKLRVWAGKLLLLGITLCVCLLVSEWFVRWQFPYFNPKAQIPFVRQPGGFALGPPLQTRRQATPKGDYDSLIRFNEDGFRDTKNLREAREADWFALGDSFTMGWGVEERERFSSRLEEIFKANHVAARIFNIAIPDNIVGYQKLLKYAESRGPKARHLILGICMENDLCDYTTVKAVWDSPVASNGPAESPKRAILQWLRQHSALYVATSFTLQKSKRMQRLLERAGVARDVDQLSGSNPWNETVLKTSRDEVLKIVTGRDAIVLIIPSRRLWSGTDKETELRMHNGFVTLLSEAGVTVLDLKGALESEGNPLSCYFKTDPHWNPRGHEVAARELFKVIQSRQSR